jgi:hypothetical protein
MQSMQTQYEQQVTQQRQESEALHKEHAQVKEEAETTKKSLATGF